MSDLDIDPTRTPDDQLAEAVFQALGYASACWERLDRAGEFQSTKAKAVGDELLAFIRSQQPAR